MSEPLPVPAANNTFERIKRVSAEGNEFWSSRDFHVSWATREAAGMDDTPYLRCGTAVRHGRLIAISIG